MILQNSFYSIKSKLVVGLEIRYDIVLDASHFIYQAHFPGEPITPGVCVIQIAKELLEDHLQQRLSVKSVKNVKFLREISPAESRQVTFAFEKVVADDTSKTYNARVRVFAHESSELIAMSGEELLARLSFVTKND